MFPGLGSALNLHRNPRKGPSDSPLCLVCRDILVGSLAGVLNEVVMDEKDKKERVAKRVFQLQDSKDPMTSVHQHRTSEGQRVVLMATADRLYIFTGKGSLEAMFARYNSPGRHTQAASSSGHPSLHNAGVATNNFSCIGLIGDS